MVFYGLNKGTKSMFVKASFGLRLIEERADIYWHITRMVKDAFVTELVCITIASRHAPHIRSLI